MKKILLFILKCINAFFCFFGDLIYAVINLRMILKGTIHYDLKKKDLVIMGNGPSLKSDMPVILNMKNENVDYMCCNSYCLSDDFFKIKPLYYVMVDPGYWRKDADPVSVSQRVATFNCFNNVNWKMSLIVPVAAMEHHVESLMKNSLISILYVNSLPMRFKLSGLAFFSYKLNIFSPTLQNVLIACIYLGINLGYKQISIFGADHSWHENIFVKDDNYVYLVEKHCYDNEPVSEHRMEWVDGKPFTIGELFQCWSIVFNQYYELNDYARFRGAKVINSSSKSYIDAFVRQEKS